MVQMVELTSRCLALAEGVVTMVCPVLLALSIKKINWKGKVEEPVVPMAMLLIAGATLITGIYPFLVCCLSKFFPTMPTTCPHVTSSVAAHLSSICLILLAGLISCLISPLKYVVPMGGSVILVATCALLILRSRANGSHKVEAEEAEKRRNEVHSMANESHTVEAEKAEETRKEVQDTLDKTHEFISSVTGILFLGLEGLALEGLISTCHGIPDAFQQPVLFSFMLCAIGVFIMLVTMIYPPTLQTKKANIVSMTFGFDLVMTVGTLAILTIITAKLTGIKGFLLFSSPALILFELAYRLVVKPKDAPDTKKPKTTPELPVTNGSTSSPQPSLVTKEKEAKAAPLGLTKVTFAGFWAMSVTTISTGSPNDWFLIFAAAGIASGLFWRLLTHSKNKDIMKTANAASFWTHLWIAVATVLFTMMAWEAANKVQVNTCAPRRQ